MKVQRFDWDSRNVEHIGRHEVSPEEAEDVFDHDPVFRKGRSGFHTVYGRTGAGRYLFVVYVRKPGAIRIITARDMTLTEKRYYRRQRGE